MDHTTLWYGQYLMRMHNHITQAVAVVDSCFSLVGIISIYFTSASEVKGKRCAVTFESCSLPGYVIC